MRKDKRLNGDLDRLPMLTWIMFLKFLDDLELQREQEWQLVNPKKSTPHLGPLPGRGGEGENPATNCTRWARSKNPCSARCAMPRARSAGGCKAPPAARRC